MYKEGKGAPKDPARATPSEALDPATVGLNEELMRQIPASVLRVAVMERGLKIRVSRKSKYGRPLTFSMMMPSR